MTPNLKKISAGFVLQAFVLCSSARLALAAAGDEFWEGLQATGVQYGGVGTIAIVGKDVYVGGQFTSVQGISATNIARFDGTNWYPLGDGIQGTPTAITADENFVYVGVAFNFGGIPPAIGVARWDGTNWSALGGGVDGAAYSLAFVGKDLYVGGGFTTAGGIIASNIARWDGENWHSLSDGIGWFDNPCVHGTCKPIVRALAARDGILYAAGWFNRAGGILVNSLAQWDGTSWSDIGSNRPGINDEIFAVVSQGSGVFIGGNMRWVPGVKGPGVAKWDGTNWSAIPKSDFEGARAIVAVGNDLYVSGGFSRVGDTIVNNITKWDGTNWSALGSGVSGYVGALASNGSELWVGGAFDTVGGKPALGLAIWHIPHSLSASRSQNQLTLSWPATGSNFVLEANASLGQINWTSVSPSPVFVGDQLVVTNEISSARRFYRLRRR